MSGIEKFLIDFTEDTTADDLKNSLDGLRIYAESRKKRIEKAKRELVMQGNILLREMEACAREEEELKAIKAEEAAMMEKVTERRAEIAKMEAEKEMVKKWKEEEPSLLFGTGVSSPEVHPSTPPRKTSEAFYFSLDSPTCTPPSLHNKPSTPTAPRHSRTPRGPKKN